MSDARKRAEEWLGRYGDDDPLTLYGLENSRVEAARLLRALLAEEPGAANFIRCAVPRGECCHQRIPAVLPLEAPECNDGDDCCRYCGRGLQPCGACKPSPLPPEVREAAECTGIAASWCPVHGNCSCPRDEEGARTENRFGVDCPLHGLASNHGDAEVSALAARRGA